MSDQQDRLAALLRELASVGDEHADLAGRAYIAIRQLAAGVNAPLAEPQAHPCLCGRPDPMAGHCFDINGDYWPGHGEVAEPRAEELREAVERLYPEVETGGHYRGCHAYVFSGGVYPPDPCSCGGPELRAALAATPPQRAVPEAASPTLRKALRAFGERLAADGYGWEAIITREGPSGEETVAHLTTSNPDPDRLASQPTPAPLDVERLARAWGEVMDGRRVGNKGLYAARINADTTTADDWDAIACAYAQQDTPEPRPLPIEMREGLGPR